MLVYRFDVQFIKQGLLLDSRIMCLRTQLMACGRFSNMRASFSV